MAEFMTGLKRTNMCGDFRIADVGKEVTLFGWVQRQRDLGQLIFIDLRDRTGIVQLAFSDETDKDIFEKAQSCRSEYVLGIRGVVAERSAKTDKIPTGDVEIQVNELRILSKAQTPPFEILDETKTGEELRLKHRYLDLRRKPLQDNLMMRSKIAKVARDYFYENGFIEIETPMMIKSTPEGARDYLVPSRIHQGKFYALPQSPQIYKQLLMLSGFDRYIQLARCFRDEDLRADRQPEFTQIDMELSFADMDEIMDINEGFFVRLFEEVLGEKLETPFTKMSYDEAKTVVQDYFKQLESSMADNNEKAGKQYLADNAKAEGVKVTKSGLQYKVIEEGTGEKPGPNDVVTVHYQGRLIDGTVFDSSIERGEPATFAVGQVIPGWVEGLQMMQEGATWQLTIPSELAYGNHGTGPIQPNSTLIFDVKLLKVQHNK